MADTKLYQVVNEADEIVGFKLRHDIDFKNDIYRIGAVWITNSKDEVLMAQRALTKDKDPGMWGPAAAGTLEKDETYETNAYKEAEEEIGLTGVKFTIGPKMRFGEPRHAFCQWYFASVDKAASDFKLQAEEVEQLAWIPKEELIADVSAHPEKYTPSMPLILKEIYSL